MVLVSFGVLLGDEILNSGQLDPRADGPVPPRPAAVIDGPSERFLTARISF